MKRILTLSALICVSVLAFGQNPFLVGLMWDPDDPTNPGAGGRELFVTINPISGQISTIDTIPGVEAVALGSSTFDQVNNEYIFWGFDNGQTGRLYRLNGNTGQIIANPPLGSFPTELEFDMNSGGLYGLTGNQSGVYFSEVDLSTGQSSLVDTQSVSNFVLSGSSTLDATTGTYYFVGGNTGGSFRLYGLDVDSGTVNSQPLMVYDLIEMEYDQTQDLIYGLYFNDAAQMLQLMEVQPFTGAATVKVSLSGFGPMADGVVLGSSIFHQATQTYFFISGGSSGTRLVSLDVANGVMLYNPVITGGNLIELQVDNTTYAAARYGQSTSVNNDFANRFTIGPNPTKGLVRLEKASLLRQRSTLRVFSMQGAVVYEEEWAGEASTKILDLSNLPIGPYFLEIHSGERSWETVILKE